MKFLIQTIEGKIVHDFSFALLESIKYQNWVRNSNDITYVLTDDEMIANHFPIGRIDFVLEYLNTYYGLNFTPINIPPELLKDEFLKRKIIYGGKSDIEGIKFVKSTTKIKHFTEIVDPKVSEIPGDDNYLISDVIPIDSEWRVFVYYNKIVGLQNYSGDFLNFPCVDTIKSMVEAYKDCPPAYSLDVGVNNTGTFVIEVHDFFSCGLYGFADHRYLPFMFTRWFNWYLEQNNQNKLICQE